MVKFNKELNIAHNTVVYTVVVLELSLVVARLTDFFIVSNCITNGKLAKLRSAMNTKPITSSTGFISASSSNLSSWQSSYLWYPPAIQSAYLLKLSWKVSPLRAPRLEPVHITTLLTNQYNSTKTIFISGTLNWHVQHCFLTNGWCLFLKIPCRYMIICTLIITTFYKIWYGIIRQ